MSNAIVSMAAVAMAAVGATNIINRKRVAVRASAHDVFIVAMVVIVAAVLMALPAQAQDAPPVAGAKSSTVYLPVLARTFPSWFTDAELTQAQRDAGYDISTAQMHTICYQDATSTPPDDLRWSSCEQYFINGIGATEGTSHYIWWLRLNDGKVHGIEVGGTMVQSSSTDAPCYVDDDGKVTCG